MFVVQTAIHAEPGEFDVREADAEGNTVCVIGLEVEAGSGPSPAA